MNILSKLIILIGLLFPLSLSAAKKTNPSNQLGPWLEPNFPFVMHSLDARKIKGSSKDNLTPRALTIKVKKNIWASFDTDLLRFSLIWSGNLQLKNMAYASYRHSSKKSQQGQGALSYPQGDLFSSMPISPGWSTIKENWEDKRRLAPDKNEVGKGPISMDLGQFFGVELLDSNALIHYRIRKTHIHEWIDFQNEQVVRNIILAPHDETFYLNISQSESDIELNSNNKQAELVYNQQKSYIAASSTAKVDFVLKDGQKLSLKCMPSKKRYQVRLYYSKNKFAESFFKKHLSASYPKFSKKKRWGTNIVAPIIKKNHTSLLSEHIVLPQPNPWNRKVRASGFDFINKDTAIVSTFDGDIWLCRGLNNKENKVIWSRLASGLDEPMSLAIKDHRIFIYTRHGIFELMDRNQNGEVDYYRMFSNQFTQTAETREFPLSMIIDKKGAFYISKGGIQNGSKGMHNGKILKISPDGKSTQLYADGFREAYLGYHKESGTLVATDQQGHYIPTTPLIEVKENAYYGFPDSTNRNPRPKITEPIQWIPHVFYPSATTPSWADHANMGELNKKLILADYNSGKLYASTYNPTSKNSIPTIYQLPAQLPFSPLYLKMNNYDGAMYISGFRIWGAHTQALSGFTRIKSNQEVKSSSFEAELYKEGIFLELSNDIDHSILDSIVIKIKQWNIKRSQRYGSGHYKTNGKPGEDHVTIKNIHILKDKKSIFIECDLSKSVHCLKLSLIIPTINNNIFQKELYFTIKQSKSKPNFTNYLKKYSNKIIKLTLETENTNTQASAKKGKLLYKNLGCIACHSISNNDEGKTGPSWKGIYGSNRTLTTQQKIKVNDPYLIESILQPNLRIVKGYKAGMPSYKGVMSNKDIQSIILYIQSLK